MKLMGEPVTINPYILLTYVVDIYFCVPFKPLFLYLGIGRHMDPMVELDDDNFSSESETEGDVRLPPAAMEVSREQVKIRLLFYFLQRSVLTFLIVMLQPQHYLYFSQKQLPRRMKTRLVIIMCAGYNFWQLFSR